MTVDISVAPGSTEAFYLFMPERQWSQLSDHTLEEELGIASKMADAWGEFIDTWPGHKVKLNNVVADAGTESMEEERHLELGDRVAIKKGPLLHESLLQHWQALVQ